MIKWGMAKTVSLPHRFSETIKPIPPYDFALTVHKPAGWPLFSRDEVWENGTLWTALPLNGELAGVKLKSQGTMRAPKISTEVFLAEAPKPAQKARMIELLTAKLGAADDLRPFYTLAEKDPVLKFATRDLYGLHNTGFSTLFGAATLAISLQMAPIKRSNEMQDCLIKRYGEAAEFDGKRIAVWPSAVKIARADVATLFKDCKLGYRAKFLVAAAKMITQGFPTLEELKEMSPEDAKEKIMDLPGMGDYSADIVNPHGGFSIDVWSADIFGVLFFGEGTDTSRNAIEKIKAEGLKRWGKWARLAFVYVVHDLPALSERLGVKLRLS
jgi:DNA-3-methyladenine glycosylase II